MRNFDLEKIGDSTNEELIEKLFGSLPEFVRLTELYGNEFKVGSVVATFDAHLNRYTFFIIQQG